MDSLSAFLHTPEWERFQAEAGLPVEREGGSVYVRRSIARRPYWQVSRISIEPSWTPPRFTGGTWFLRVEPDSAESLAALQGVAHRLKAGLHRTAAHQPSQTAVVDLSQDEASILAGFKQKHRYNVKVAQKYGVSTEFYAQDAPDHFDRFWKLLSETSERHTFRTHSERYYRLMLKHLAPTGKASLGFATLEGHDLAAILLIHEGPVTTYLHGASTQARKETMAPFLLHWEAMVRAKAAGTLRYDLWGTHAVKDDTGAWKPIDGHASAGTTRFKLGFGVSIVEYPGTYDLVFQALAYRLYAAVRGIRSRKRAFA